MPSTSSGTPSLQLPSAPSLDHCASVLRHAAQVARPCICALFKLGVPRLGLQVARQGDFLELACHAFDTKWHAIVEVLLEMRSYQHPPNHPSQHPYQNQHDHSQHSNLNPPSPTEDRLSRIETLLEDICKEVQDSRVFKDEVRANIKNQGDTIKRLESQVGYLS
ncbi:hypothetical protein AHAS_Ahas05G0141900 [Arachis hypogaea]